LKPAKLDTFFTGAENWESPRRIEALVWVEIEGLALDSSQDFTPFDAPLLTS